MKTTMDFQWNEDLLYEFMNSLWSNDRFKRDDFIRELEYFKKSKEQKEYEVLSFKHKYSSYTKWHDEFYYRTDGKYYDTSLNHVPENAEILSVKRLYDGEVFRVGDLVKWNLERNSQTPFLIESFEENHMHPTKERMFCNNKNMDICYLEKVKEVLFTTEDGVPVYERDTFPVYEVDKDFQILQFAACDASGNSNSGKYFSTKEAAEHWVNWNEPKYSKKEMEACYEHALTQGVHGCSFKSYMNWMENYFSKSKL